MEGLRKEIFVKLKTGCLFFAKCQVFEKLSRNARIIVTIRSEYFFVIISMNVQEVFSGILENLVKLIIGRLRADNTFSLNFRKTISD